MRDSPAEARNRFERHPRLTLVAVTSILILVLDISLARLVGPNLSVRESQRSFRVPSPIYHHDLRPNVKIDEARWGHLVYSVRTNSLGFRDATVRDVALLPAGHRIVFIGDSFTEGIGYVYEDTFVGIAARRLADRGVEVLNAAVASYSPITYFSKLRYFIETKNLRFQELFVFIDITDPYDEMLYQLDEDGVVAAERRSSEDQKRRHLAAGASGAKRHEPTSLRGRLASLQRGSLILRALLRLDEALTRPSPDEAAKRKARRKQRKAAADELTDAGIERAIAHMDRLEKLTRKAGITVTVAVYPHKAQIRQGDLEPLHARIWKEWASRHGLPILDFYPCFIGRDPSHEVIDRFFIRGDVHWNEQGHRLLATELLLYYEGAGDVCGERPGEPEAERRR